MEKTFAICEFTKITGLPTAFVNKAIFEDKLHLVNERIPESVLTKYNSENEHYISITEFIETYSGGRLKSKVANERKKLITFLEINNYFGLSPVSYNRLLLRREREGPFFERKDAVMLAEKCRDFFATYGMTDEEKIDYYIKTSKSSERLKKSVRDFLENGMYGKKLNPSVVDFVMLVLTLDDVLSITNEDVRHIFAMAQTSKTKSIISLWLNYVCRFYETPYKQAIVVKEGRSRTTRDTSAYSYNTYVGLARCIFGSEYIYEHDMIKKALDNSMYAEIWMYLALFFVCGWRAGDICRGWKYPDLKNNKALVEQLGINTETLYEDILNDSIPDETYEKICEYSIGKVSTAGQYPHKTARLGDSTLMVAITPELYPFFGLLNLIAETHMLRDGSGYMDLKKKNKYQLLYNLRPFFGQEIADILDNKNILTRRLNKDYLQAIENAGRRQGIGSIQTAMIASFARNHRDFGTISTYLKDFSYTQENAETVLYFIAQRGVFAFDLYQTCLTAYGDKMNALSMEEQTALMEQFENRPLVVEQRISEEYTKSSLSLMFINGETEIVNKMLRAMYEISQAHGKSKDEGTYCIKRALGEACVNPKCESCIASGCKNLVISRMGYVPLLEVLYGYYDRGRNGDRRAQSILDKVLMPRFQSVINRLIKEKNLNNDDREGLSKLIQEVFGNGTGTANNKT